MKINYSVGKVGIAAVLLSALTGCTTYVVQQPEPPSAYVPAPPPEPQPVYVQSAPVAPPAVVVIQSQDDFVQPLSPYGQWVTVGSYGRCWRPAQVEANWRPYSNGHWELTDDGWYWDSDEPWAWATYHYGRWEQAPNYGWIWVPQTQWAPAWVSWREGGGYVGWAPLPPEPRGGVSVNVTIAPASFCYVQESQMHEPVRPTTVIVNNTTIINKTVNITKTKVVNKVVINEGPRSDEVERVSGRKIEKVSVTDLRHKEEEPIAEKHTNLRAPAADRNQPSAPHDNNNNNSALQNLENLKAHPNPAPQLPPHQVEKPVRVRPVGPEPEPAKPVIQAQPAPMIPQHPAPPVDDKNNRERQARDQNPPAKPAPREVRPLEKPTAPPAADNQNRSRQPNAPQFQPAPKPEKERPVKAQKQPKVPTPKNTGNTSQQNGRNREAGTNAPDNSEQGGRR